MGQVASRPVESSPTRLDGPAGQVQEGASLTSGALSFSSPVPSTSSRPGLIQLEHSYWTPAMLQACVPAWLTRRMTGRQKTRLKWLRSEAFDRFVRHVGTAEALTAETYLRGGDWEDAAYRLGQGQKAADRFVNHFFDAASWFALRDDIEASCAHHRSSSRPVSSPLDWSVTRESVPQSEGRGMLQAARKIRAVVVDSMRGSSVGAVCAACDFVRSVSWDGWVPAGMVGGR